MTNRFSRMFFVTITSLLVCFLILLVNEAAYASTIAVGRYHTVALKEDGSVIAIGGNGKGQCNVDNWKDIVQVAAGGLHTVGLRSNGTVVAVGDTMWEQCDVDDWQDIVQIGAMWNSTVGLKADGTVVVTYENDTATWSNIKEIFCGMGHIVGLKNDGTVVAIGDNDMGQCMIDHWSNIAQVACGNDFTIGIKNDGQIVVEGNFKHEIQNELNTWDGLVSISAYYRSIAGVMSDGTVKFYGWGDSQITNSYDESAWNNVVDVVAGWVHFVGLRNDGTLVADRNVTGMLMNEYKDLAMCDVANITGIATEAKAVQKNTLDTESVYENALTLEWADDTYGLVDGLYSEATGGRGSEIGIISNTAWTVKAPEWVSIQPASGTGNGSFTVYVDENQGEYREGFIYVYANSCDTLSMRITQKGIVTDKETVADEPFLDGEVVSFSPQEFILKWGDDVSAQFDGLHTLAKGGFAGKFDIISNTWWTIDAPSWVGLTSVAGNGSNHFSIYVDKNNGKYREGFIYVNADGCDTLSMRITQNGKKDDEKLAVNKELLDDDSVIVASLKGSAYTNSNNEYAITVEYIDDDGKLQIFQPNSQGNLIYTARPYLPITLTVRDRYGNRLEKEDFSWKFTYPTKAIVGPTVKEGDTVLLDDYDYQATNGVTTWTCKLSKKEGWFRKKEIETFTISIDRVMASKKRFQMMLSGIEDYTRIDKPRTANSDYQCTIVNSNNINPKVAFSVLDVDNAITIDGNNRTDGFGYRYATKYGTYSFFLTIDSTNPKSKTYPIRAIKGGKDLKLDPTCAIEIKPEFKYSIGSDGFKTTYEKKHTIYLWRDDYIIDSYTVEASVYDGDYVSPGEQYKMMFKDIGDATADALGTMIMGLTAETLIAIDGVVYQVKEGPNLGKSLLTIGAISDVDDVVRENIVKNIILEDLIGYDSETSQYIFWGYEGIGAMFNPIDAILYAADKQVELRKLQSDECYYEDTVKKANGLMTIINFVSD